MAAEQLAVATARKSYLFTYILNNVVTFRQRKLRKLARKSAHEHVIAVSTTSMANVTRQTRTRVSLAAH